MSGLQQRHSRQPLQDQKSTCPNPDDERPSRRAKFESRLYNFLTRSRSRSRSKQDPSDDTKLSRRPSVKKDTTNSMSGTKPVSRIPSRPLSSTTATTNNTITPGTPKPKRKLTSAPLLPQPQPLQDVSLNGTSSSRPTTPKPKKKLQNLFGIPLALANRKSSRSRSRSRPNTPEPSSDVPPLPTTGFSDDSAPKPRQSHSPHSSRPQTPTRSRPSDPLSNGMSTGSTSNSLKLPKLFSGRTITSSEGNQHRQRPSTSASVNTSSKPKSGISGPIRRPVSATRRTLKPDAPPDPSPPKSSKASNGVPPRQLTPPKPPTPPPKKAPVNGNALSLPTKGKVMTHHVPKFNSVDGGYRYRGGNMSVVDEEGRLDLSRTSSLKGKSREAEPNAHLRSGLKKMSIDVRNTKHGSFDFERPGWGASLMHRTGSTGTNGSHHSKIGDLLVQDLEQRESTFGPGLAGVGTLQRDLSIKRLKDTEEEIKARERARRLHEYIHKDRLPPIPTINGHDSKEDNLNASTSTSGTAQTGKSSSLSKATGRRAASRTGGSGHGLTRLIGTAQHPPFPFEPAVPSPTWSIGSNSTAVETSKTDKGARLKEDVKRREAERKLVGKGDRPPVPVPSPSSTGYHRPGNRGRSLDLGLGLNWAPSTIKEAALLPSSTLFTRTASSSTTRSTSGQSVVGRSASSSTNGQGSGRSQRSPLQDVEEDGGRSQLGKEVAELFRNVLDDRGYNTFKSYVRRFDAGEIEFDGRNGIVERVERLLTDAPSVSSQDKRLILEKFVRIILQNA
ncbi:hypothetical protein CC1G_00180 [Coprinopsis cinerea okayama7|uniref:Uncharacterized protein n=1 Tax=Coprinopsis cinerea (strain Okayama-7 / 130 / ATCC MYA-4618 / FGSC 9003) TaxID=240176 RepID=A8NX21_COPC7|nr:hypothetical protein CC1G_00180 [Coprinopsis cinerea okayama7\|eukprot:XP_001837044.2 hypothetical protein CC1G_00180 [Coprinopsis cinerea okayama7\